MADLPLATGRGRPHYAWIVASVTFLALLSSAGIGATRAVLVLPLEREFGWDRATISLALSVNLLLFGLCGPFAGALMTRFGVRRVMLSALGTLAVVVSLSTFMQSSWQLVLLWGVLVGLGSGAMALVLGATASGWLSDRISPRKLLAWYYTLRGLALLFLPAAYELGAPALAGFVVIYGLDWVATVPPTVKLVSERFGKDRVGPVFGWIFAAHQLGGSAAAFGAGLAHSLLGDYLLAWLIAGGLSLLAAGLVLGLRNGRTWSLRIDDHRGANAGPIPEPLAVR